MDEVELLAFAKGTQRHSILENNSGTNNRIYFTEINQSFGFEIGFTEEFQRFLNRHTCRLVSLLTMLCGSVSSRIFQQQS
jgi:hypothetical protein